MYLQSSNFVVQLYNNYFSIVLFSFRLHDQTDDNNCHDPAAIWAHLMPVIEMFKAENPETKIMHFLSDGPSSQYRQKKELLFTQFIHLETET